eukprot:scpid42080/ scgid17909/ 
MAPVITVTKPRRGADIAWTLQDPSQLTTYTSNDSHRNVTNPIATKIQKDTHTFQTQVAILRSYDPCYSTGQRLRLHVRHSHCVPPGNHIVIADKQRLGANWTQVTSSRTADRRKPMECCVWRVTKVGNYFLNFTPADGDSMISKN